MAGKKQKFGLGKNGTLWGWDGKEGTWPMLGWGKGDVCVLCFAEMNERQVKGKVRYYQQMEGGGKSLFIPWNFMKKPKKPKKEEKQAKKNN